MTNELVIVTASVNPEKTLDFWSTWRGETNNTPLVLVVSGKGKDPEALGERVLGKLRHADNLVMREKIDGTINPFLAGIEAAAEYKPKLVACFHDDLAIDEESWTGKVLEVFAQDKKAVLAGFGGGIGLGTADIYQTPYNPMQLARQDFISNMRDAEVHGRRVKETTRVACLDGFSQIGKIDFLWECYKQAQILGIRHHAYDSLFGAWAYASGWNAYMIPIACHHQGGVTAVGSEEYQKYARGEHPDGDQEFWRQAHEVMYRECEGVLPFGFWKERSS